MNWKEDKSHHPTCICRRQNLSEERDLKCIKCGLEFKEYLSDWEECFSCYTERISNREQTIVEGAINVLL